MGPSMSSLKDGSKSLVSTDSKRLLHGASYPLAKKNFIILLPDLYRAAAELNIVSFYFHLTS